MTFKKQGGMRNAMVHKENAQAQGNLRKLYKGITLGKAARMRRDGGKSWRESRLVGMRDGYRRILGERHELQPSTAYQRKMDHFGCWLQVKILLEGEMGR